MWAKVPFHRAKKSAAIENSANASSLNQSDNRSPNRSSSALSGGQRYYSKDLPALPNEDQELSCPGKHPDSKPRSASATFTRFAPAEPPRHRATSAASQLPSDQPYFDRDPKDSSLASPDISPPGTPNSLNHGLHSRGSSQISPIEEEPQHDSIKVEQMEAKLASHIPTLRKDARKENFESNSERSYKLSGHSHENSGKFGGHSSRVISWGKEQLQPKKKFAEVRSRIAKQNDDASPFIVHEPWRGPSGRAPIMNPIYETSRARSSSRLHPSRSSDRLREYDQALPDSTARLQPSVVTTITAQDKPAGSRKQSTSRSRAPSASAGSQPPVSEGYKNSAPPRVDLPVSDLNSSLAEFKLTAPTPTTDTFPTDNERQPDQSELPVSRSSAATDTSARMGDTRTSSPAPGSIADSIESASHQSTDNGLSIMSRKRPVPSTMAPGRKPVRKPTPNQAAEEAAAKGLSLVLPQEQQQPKNRIEALEERQGTLARRKTNITTIIDELNQVFQPTSTAYDMAAREEVKKTIAHLNNELADIVREEHDIGLRLLRAWKKRDEQDLYGGGTGLWVKRVTS
ncbi:hypothetical protein SI65_05812 [Aspergillus cristatus]|uniref:BHLH domain-containing protein n=1 Tax=Aspergillus cristatus TaxID=573508 RepID=A0A1E3BDZ0_ASPCR|nr:hypothetical protein SI65_05812 [Aspergillus cristatus]